ncbi:hypothetical protein Acr_02g0006570 [Actinidia rufa]|uniref:Uncharacterized protein n=1 Tax=Actinidia rufa TaxID=165716 RepID=A0A7J0E9T2_9ERIC|nr:hypothetical protein Acr_02g0006570 [Actinidia rufa]
MHLRSRLLPKPSVSSPLDNRAHPMANTSQTSDLEGLHREIHGMVEQMRIMNENNARLIQHLTANNPSTLAPPTPHCSHHSGDNESQSHHNTGRDRRRRSPIPRRRKRSSSSESRSSSETPKIEGEEVRRRGRSPGQNDQVPKRREKSTTQKIRDLNAKIDAINADASAPVTVDALIRQTEPLFTKRIMRTRVSSKFKLPIELEVYEGKTDPMDHLHSYKSLKNVSYLFIVYQKKTESLKDYIKRFNQAVLEVEYPSDKIVIMAMMEGLHSGPLFDSLFKKVHATLSALQSKADKYITAEELAEAKRRRRRRDDHKRKGSPRYPMRSTH